MCNKRAKPVNGGTFMFFLFWGLPADGFFLGGKIVLEKTSATYMPRMSGVFRLFFSPTKSPGIVIQVSHHHWMAY